MTWSDFGPPGMGIQNLSTFQRSFILVLVLAQYSLRLIGRPSGKCISLRVVVAIEIAHYGGDSKSHQACLSRLVLATVWYSFILVHPLIVEVIAPVFPLRLGNTEVLLLVDAPGQSVSRDLAFLPHWSF